MGTCARSETESIVPICNEYWRPGGQIMRSVSPHALSVLGCFARDRRNQGIFVGRNDTTLDPLPEIDLSRDHSDITIDPAIGD